jgi:hypothetical protein
VGYLAVLVRTTGRTAGARAGESRVVSGLVGNSPILTPSNRPPPVLTSARPPSMPEPESKHRFRPHCSHPNLLAPWRNSALSGRLEPILFHPCQEIDSRHGEVGGVTYDGINAAAWAKSCAVIVHPIINLVRWEG